MMRRNHEFFCPCALSPGFREARENGPGMRDAVGAQAPLPLVVCVCVCVCSVLLTRVDGF